MGLIYRLSGLSSDWSPSRNQNQPLMVVYPHVQTPELTPVIQYYLPLYTKPNARITVTVDALKISYVAQSYALQPAVAATSILIEM